MVLVPEYVVMVEYACKLNDFGDTKTLPAGAYVKPIDLYYISPVTLEKWKFFNKEKEVFCYTAYGILPIPKNIVRLR